MAYFGLAGALSLAGVGAFVGSLVALLLTAVRWRRWGRPGLLVLDSLSAGGVVAALAVIALATLQPFEALGTRTGTPPLVNPVPLRALARGGLGFFVLNVLLFAPLGAVLRLRYPRIDWWRIALVGLLVSGVIEALQLLHPVRGTNVDDVLSNAAGTVLGAWLAQPLGRWLIAVRSRGR